jgi:glutathione S-transferase
MPIRLYDFAPSPFCLKVRAILDHKRVPYERISVLGRGMVDVWRRGRIGKVPMLELDGELVCDSTDIAYAVEARFPEPRIVPADRQERARCHVLEDWADESVYWLGIYYRWLHPEGRAGVSSAFGKGPLGKGIYHFYRRTIDKQLQGQGVGRKPEPQVRRDLERTLDAVEALLEGRPYLLGEAPLLCDFALLGQLVYLHRTPVGHEHLRARTATLAFIERMRAARERAAA